MEETVEMFVSQNLWASIHRWSFICVQFPQSSAFSIQDSQICMKATSHDHDGEVFRFVTWNDVFHNEMKDKYNKTTTQRI